MRLRLLLLPLIAAGVIRVPSGECVSTRRDNLKAYMVDARGPDALQTAPVERLATLLDLPTPVTVYCIGTVLYGDDEALRSWCVDALRNMTLDPPLPKQKARVAPPSPVLRCFEVRAVSVGEVVENEAIFLDCLGRFLRGAVKFMMHPAPCDNALWNRCNCSTLGDIAARFDCMLGRSTTQPL